MFEREDMPRLFGLPPGVDFPRAVIAGLMQRLAGAPPEQVARTEIFVNTRRMQRRLRSLFEDGGARLLPRIRLVTDLAAEEALDAIPPPVPPLRQRLELAQLIARLLDREPDLAPRSSVFDLADSLAGLMDEMRGEGVAPQVIRGLDVSDQSGHWQRSLKFVSLVDEFLRAERAPDVEGRQRLVVERLADRWAERPPRHPVLVAGSTGSRGATALFMRTVARLPQGAVILPGVDFDLPETVWGALHDAMTGEDHPQFRFARLIRALDLTPSAIRRWVDIEPPNAPRNRLVSLALRPAPVTDHWMTEAPRLEGIDRAVQAVSLVEAPSIRAEASTVALALRGAVEDGRVAALITPDRVLTRQVTAALNRWGIVPDDSAGAPLHLSAPGRFLRLVASLFGQVLTAQALLALLKHPLTNTGSAERGAHLLWTRELELKLRRFGPPFPQAGDLAEWAAGGEPARTAWAGWLAGLLAGLESVGTRSLASHLDHHIRLAESLAQGPEGTGSGALWNEAAGIEAERWIAELRQEAGFGGTMTPAEYASLINSVLQRGEVREATVAHPGVMIWGTLEARVQGADLVILGGLNEGVWPETAAPDPWLNRRMRHDAALLLPERRIGLSAHDFQQAIAAQEVILTRSIRDSDAQTVPSRWLNRLVNLLNGLPDTGAPGLKAMRARGARLLAMAERLDRPDAALLQEMTPARRPSPRPPVNARPRRLSITEIQTLIRDPYAIYARHVLRLTPLDPLQRQPDAPLRGTIFHGIVERFIRAGEVRDPEEARDRLLDIADRVLLAQAPWPSAQRMWRARLIRVADWFVAGEIARQDTLRPVALERKGRFDLPDAELTLTGKIDRIDRDLSGALVIYDYKTGPLPTRDQRQHFDKQLALAAMMAERGAIESLDPATVREVAYIGLGATPRIDVDPVSPGDTDQTLIQLNRLIGAYRQPQQGYTARRAKMLQTHGGHYDHLARFGEWDESDAPCPMDVGR